MEAIGLLDAPSAFASRGLQKMERLLEAGGFGYWSDGSASEERVGLEGNEPSRSHECK